MRVKDGDRRIVAWAREHGYPHYYCDEIELPRPCLKVHLGQVVACFHEGALVRLTLRIDGELMNEAFHHLHELLTVCEDAGAYLQQQPAANAVLRMPTCFSVN